MRRLLVLVLVLYLVWRVLNIVGRRLEQRSREITEEGLAGRGSRRRAATGGGEQERLLPCARCGTLVPASRALTSGDASYCSPECRDGAGKGDGSGAS